MDQGKRVTGSDGRGAIAGATGESFAPEVVAVETVCGVHKRPFLLFVERKDSSQWCARRSYPLPETLAVVPMQELAARQGVAVSTLSKLALSGGLLVGKDYAGCAWCLDKGIIRCGCGALSCQGARQSHDGHGDIFCAACDRWRCLSSPVPLSLKTLEGYGAVVRRSLSVEIVHPELKSGDSSPKMIAAAKEKALVRRPKG